MSLVFVLQSLPWLLLSLPAGAFVDRHSPKRMMIAADLLRASDMLLLVLALWLGTPRLALIGFVAFVLGVGEILSYAASTSLLPRLASRTDLIHANGRLAALTSSGEQVVGPALGGVLFQSASSLPFIGNLASFLLSAGLLAALPATPADTTAGRRELKTEIAEALHWYRGALALRWLTGFVCLIALGQAMLLSLLVLFGIEQLGLTARGFGLVLGLIALGNVFGGLIAERLWSLLRTSHVLVLCGQIIALSTAAVALTKTTWVAIVVLAAEAIAVVVCNVVTATYRQVVVPAALRGRVNSLFRSLLYGMGPIGGVLAGYVAHTSSIALAFRIAGGIQLAAVVLCGPALWKHLPMTGRELTATPD